MKKYFFIIALAILVLTLAGCGESVKTKTRLSTPVNQNIEDNTLSTGQVAGEEDMPTVSEKPLSGESANP
ncbi:MAG: hypothetical protein WC528_05630 [Patescibacteria group bacterium]